MMNGLIAGMALFDYYRMTAPQFKGDGLILARLAFKFLIGDTDLKSEKIVFALFKLVSLPSPGALEASGGRRCAHPSIFEMIFKILHSLLYLVAAMQAAASPERMLDVGGAFGREWLEGRTAGATEPAVEGDLFRWGEGPRGNPLESPVCRQ